MTNHERYFLAQDHSCHWYLVEAGKRDEWEAWLEIDEDDPASWDMPSFARAIDGSADYVTFSNPVEE